MARSTVATALARLKWKPSRAREAFMATLMNLSGMIFLMPPHFPKAACRPTRRTISDTPLAGRYLFPAFKQGSQQDFLFLVARVAQGAGSGQSRQCNRALPGRAWRRFQRFVSRSSGLLQQLPYRSQHPRALSRKHRTRRYRQLSGAGGRNSRAYAGSEYLERFSYPADDLAGRTDSCGPQFYGQG